MKNPQKPQKHVFPNGCTLVYQQSKELPVCAVYAYVRVGSINENDENRGSSHFIEHMCFKGTRKIANAKDIFTAYDKIGAVFNAFTEKDHTCFYFHCGDEYIQNCINILLDIILNSLFKEKEYRMETPILLEEMIRAEDDPDTKLFHEIERFLYSGTPYSEPVDNIEYHRSKFPYDYNETLEYYKTYYKPENIVLSVVSSYSFSEIKDSVGKILSYNIKQSNNRTKKRHFHQQKESIIVAIANSNNLSPPVSKEITYKIMEKKGMKSHHLCIAFRVCDHSHSDRYPLNILSQIVGGGMGSRMSMLLREQNGLTYESSCTTDYYRVGGDFEFYAVLDPKKLFHNGERENPGVLPLIVGLIRTLIRDGIKEEEVKIAKGNYKGKFILQQEKVSHSASYNGLQYSTYNNEPFVPYSEIYEKCYNDITVEQVNEVLRKYLIPSNMCVGIIGENNTNFPKLNKVKHICDALFQ
jgi:predicted Zn-dependent peptidase